MDDRPRSQQGAVEFRAPDDPAAAGSTVLRWILVVGALAVAAGIAWWSWSANAGLSRDLTVSWLTESMRVAEDVGVVEVTALLSEPAPQDLVLDLRVRGTATIEEDFDLGGNPLTIPAGRDRAVLRIDVVDDGSSGEGTERLVLDFGERFQGTRPGRFILVITEARDRTARRENAPPATTQRRETGPTTTAADPAVSAPTQAVSALAEGTATDSEIALVGLHDVRSPAVLLLIVSSATSTAPTPVPAITDASTEFELVETATRQGGPRRLSVFRAASGGDASLDTSIRFDEKQEVIDWVLLEVVGAPPGLNGADAILQTATAAAVDFELTAAVTLESPVSSDSVTVGAFFIGANRASGGPGWATLADVGPPERLLIAVAARGSATATVDWPTRAHWIGLAVEVSVP